MVADAATAEAAASQVGYESPSQFSHEYACMFGAPPRRDAGDCTGREPGGVSPQAIVHRREEDLGSGPSSA